MKYYGIKFENDTLFTAESYDKTTMKDAGYDITENEEDYLRLCRYYKNRMRSKIEIEACGIE